MEWISRSDGPRLFQCRDGTLLLTRCLLRRQDLSRSDQCTPGSPALFPLFCPPLKNENADVRILLSDSKAFGRQVWGAVERAELAIKEEVCVRNVRTRSLGDHSPGSPSVWQLWKFIAIDFVISSLSIRSTWAHWWIARKLFLQSCFFFKSTPPPLKEAVRVLPSFHSHLLRCLHRSFYFLSHLFAVKHSIKAKFGSAPSQNCVCVKVCKTEQNVDLILRTVKGTRDNYVTPCPHLWLFSFSFLFVLGFCSSLTHFPHSPYKTTYFILPQRIWKASGWEMSQGPGNTVVPVNEFGAKPEICFAFYRPTWWNMHWQGETSQATNDMLSPEYKMPVNQWGNVQPRTVPEGSWETKAGTEKGKADTESLT